LRIATARWKALVFAGSFERLAPLVVEDQAVVVRGLALPEESGPPKISVQEIVALDNARVICDGDFHPCVAGRNGSVDKAQALEELFRRKPGETQVRLRLEAPRDFSMLLDVPAKVRPDREFRKRWRRSAGRKRLNGWRIGHRPRRGLESHVWTSAGEDLCTTGIPRCHQPSWCSNSLRRASLPRRPALC